MTLHRYLRSLLLGLTLVGTASASDIAKEQRWAEQLREQLLVGEALQLSATQAAAKQGAGQQEFLALFTPASTINKAVTPRGAVILLHGLGAHPDWPDVIAPLREQLPDAGWATLSIQLPVHPNEAEFSDYPPLFPEANARISASVQHLQQQGLLNIALVGHSLGAAMGAHFLASQAPGSEMVRAFVGIGMNHAPGTVAHTPDALAKITLPVLDIFGALDLEGVLNSAKARAASQANNANYRQTAIAGADHFFRGLDATLNKRVSSWLKRAAPSMTLDKKAE